MSSSSSDSDIDIEYKGRGAAQYTPLRSTCHKRKKKRNTKQSEKRQPLKYICRHQPCNSSFRNLSHLREHDRTHTRVRPFSCRLCDHINSTESSLMIHIRKTHFKDALMEDFEGSSLPEKLGSHARIDEGALELEASIIDDWLESEQYRRLLDDAKKSKNVNSDKPRRKSSQKGKNKQQRTSKTVTPTITLTTPRSSLVCRHCRKTGFRSLLIFLHHDRTHTGIKPYFCKYEECTLTATQKSVIKTHLKNVHNLSSDDNLDGFIGESKQLLEEELIRLTGQSSVLEQQQPVNSSTVDADKQFVPSSTQEGQQPNSSSDAKEQSFSSITSCTSLVCRHCSKSGFRSFRDYREHDRTHSGIKPYLCDFPYCSKTLSTISSAKTHFFRMHNPSGNLVSKDYIKELADLLNEEFNRLTSYEQPPVQEQQQPENSSTADADEQLVPSTSQTSFVCQHCGKSNFRCMQHFCSHDRMHSGIKPYLCKFLECSYTSSHRCNVKTHFERKHNPFGVLKSEEFIEERKDLLAEELARLTSYEQYPEQEQQQPEDSFAADELPSVDAIKMDLSFSHERPVSPSSSLSQSLTPSPPPSRSSSPIPSTSSKAIFLPETALQFKDDDDESDQSSNEEDGSESSSEEEVSRAPPELGPLVICCTAPEDGSRFICQRPNCGKKLGDISSLKCHDRIHRGVKPYKCRYRRCGHTCAVESNLLTHIRKKHFYLKKASSRLNLEKYIKENREELLFEKTLFESADRFFLSSKNTEESDKEDVGDNVEDEEDSISSSSSSDSDSSLSDVSLESERIMEELRILKAQLAAEESKPFGCTFRKCKARFDDENVWRDHEREHFRVKAYTCIYPKNVDDNEVENLGEGSSTEIEKKDKVCGKGFYSLAKIQEHIRDEHISSKSIHFSDEHISQYIFIDPDFIKL